ncbi:unnamed protein product [Pleuronectes platessa]|uniref:Uncharacterized protein n=1 Tax=Pleuronectes platessa TaxID=8262 RepID=A0A9N7YYM4_PLEPL|nr:unnamed protein product [Pleuronectes platessa]
MCWRRLTDALASGGGKPPWLWSLTHVTLTRPSQPPTPEESPAVPAESNLSLPAAPPEAGPSDMEPSLGSDYVNFKLIQKTNFTGEKSATSQSLKHTFLIKQDTLKMTQTHTQWDLVVPPLSRPTHSPCSSEDYA